MIRKQMTRSFAAKFVGLTAVAAAALAVSPQAASADFEQGDFELTLGGTGSNGPDFDGVNFSANGSLGYFATDALEVGVRQFATFTDVGTDGGQLGGSTAVFVDYHFEVGENFFPYVGANIGYAYGDAVSDTFFAAPEGGVKFFVNDTTFVFGAVEYQFFFDEAEEADDTFSDGQFLYTLGIGFVF